MTEEQIIQEAFKKTICYLGDESIKLNGKDPESYIAAEILNKNFLMNLAILMAKGVVTNHPFCYDFLRGIVFYALYLKHKEELELEETFKLE